MPERKLSQPKKLERTGKIEMKRTIRKSGSLDEIPDTISEIDKRLAMQLMPMINDGRDYAVHWQHSRHHVDVPQIAYYGDRFQTGVELTAAVLVLLRHRADAEIGECCEIPNALSQDDSIVYGDDSRFRRVTVDLADYRRDYWERVA